MAAPSQSQAVQSGQYIINNSSGMQVTIQEGSGVAGQIVTVDSQGNFLPAAPEKANEVQFLTASTDASGIVELETGEDYGNRMIITEDEGDALVIGETVQ